MSTPREKLLAQFRELVIERLGKVSRALMTLEGGPSVEAGRETLRELHGLKGEARMMGFAEVNTLVHQMEELVRTVEPLEFGLQAGSVDALLACGDGVALLAGATTGEAPDTKRLHTWLEQCTEAERERVGREVKPAGPAPSSPSGAASPPPSSPSGAAAPPSAPVPRASAPGAETDRRTAKVDGTIRISHKSLEVLTSTGTSMQHRSTRRLASSITTTQLAFELRQLHRLAEDLGPKAAELASRLNRTKEQVSELARTGSVLNGEDAKDLQLLQGEVQGLRMVPLAVLFEPYPRTVRELSRDLGKDVELSVQGENEQVDRSVLDALAEPLLHLVRNALDHGLEDPDGRASAHKAPRGRLTLSAQREGDRLALSVSDDGRGLDAGALRQLALRRGVIDAAAAEGLSDAAALDLVFLPGFTSRDSVSDVSGRGVGLDAVRTRLLSVGGEVTLETAVGKGTTFTLRVPMSLALAPVLFVQVADERVCLPASGVVRALHLETGWLREVAGRRSVVVGEAVLPLGRLAHLLGVGPDPAPLEGELLLVLRGRGHEAAVLVDRVLEERVQAILPLKGLLAGFPYLSGATQMVDGALALVLSMAHVVGAVLGREHTLEAMLSGRSTERRKRLLVVDDSPLTRELLVSLLEAAGYLIVQAADGAEAMERLASETVDCVVTDLEMPRVDGLELTRRIKSHATLRTLPVVIVTTRGSDVDRRRGMEAGADGYVAKSDLVRKDLADVLMRLLG